jgi:hypothetical protein
MKNFDPVNAMAVEFQAAFSTFLARPSVARLVCGEATLKEYGSFMRQVFHQTRENPQTQAHATLFFRGKQRECVRGFLKHALAEVDHDELARIDLRHLGVPMSELADDIPFERALPETIALSAYIFHQIQHVSPLCYVGFMYFLEFMPTTVGEGATAALDHMGVPENCRSFIQDHVTIDMAHTKLMDNYLTQMVRNEDELAIVAGAMRDTATLYGHMIDAAFDSSSSCELRGEARAEFEPSGVREQEVEFA